MGGGRARGSWRILVAVRLRLREAHLAAGERSQLIEADVGPVYVRSRQGIGLRVAATQGNGPLPQCPMPGSCIAIRRYFYTGSN